MICRCPNVDPSSFSGNTDRSMSFGHTATALLDILLLKSSDIGTFIQKTTKLVYIRWFRDLRH